MWAPSYEMAFPVAGGHVAKPKPKSLFHWLSRLFLILTGVCLSCKGVVLSQGKALRRNKKHMIPNTITHKQITELNPKRFRFGNSSTQITEHSSQNNSVRSRWSSAHTSYRDQIIPETVRVGKYSARITEKKTRK